jgi:hypothetical protein
VSPSGRGTDPTVSEWAIAADPDCYGLALNSPCFIPRKNATTEKAIIEGRTIVKTVEGVITDVSATVATATIATSGATERAKSNSITTVVAERTKIVEVGHPISPVLTSSGTA